MLGNSSLAPAVFVSSVLELVPPACVLVWIVNSYLPDLYSCSPSVRLDLVRSERNTHLHWGY